MNKKALIVHIIICLTITVLGTAQTPDILLIEGSVHHIYGFKLSEEMIKKRNLYFSIPSNYHAPSSNHDGFYAILELRGNKLYLKSLKIDQPITKPGFNNPSTEEIFGIKIPGSGIFAYWFSGELTEYFGQPFFEHLKSNERNYSFNKGILSNIYEKVNEFFKEYNKYLENNNKTDG